MGLQVVSSDGAAMGPGRSVLRFLGYIVSLLPLGAGFLWVLGDDERTGWHDHIARTQVITNRESCWALVLVGGRPACLQRRRHRHPPATGDTEHDPNRSLAPGGGQRRWAGYRGRGGAGPPWWWWAAAPRPRVASVAAEQDEWAMRRLMSGRWPGHG